MACYGCIYFEKDPDDGRRICNKGVKGYLYSGNGCAHFDDGIQHKEEEEEK